MYIYIAEVKTKIAQRIDSKNMEQLDITAKIWRQQKTLRPKGVHEIALSLTDDPTLVMRYAFCDEVVTLLCWQRLHMRWPFCPWAFFYNRHSSGNSIGRFIKDDVSAYLDNTASNSK